MNFREGFRREDDMLPERFFKDAYTLGPQKGVLLSKEEFAEIMDDYYQQRGWDQQTSQPQPETIAALELDYVKL